MNSLIVSLVILTNVLTFELAVTPDEKEKGMMFRRTWTPIDGMIFINDEPGNVTFWMKNTYLPMTMYYLDSDWNVLETHQGVPFSVQLIPSQHDNVRYVLELNPNLDSEFLKDFPEFQKKIRVQVREALKSRGARSESDH